MARNLLICKECHQRIDHPFTAAFSQTQNNHFSSPAILTIH